jgi:23S rRNA U2552 (ribose-2'-O)-methylase RlmE/FtsJ
MTSYKFSCKDIKLEEEIIFVYQDINYNILEKDINNICKRVITKSLMSKKKIEQINELITFRLNKQYHNLSIIDKSLLDEINEYKTMISKNSYNWNKYKLFTNDYEMVYNSKYNNNSIANKKPLSRSYFKMIEIANKYLTKWITKRTKKIKTLHLAEGPGGFIEALIDLRKNNYFNNNDLYYGISLKTEKNVPGWDKSTQFLKNNNNVKIITGITGTGDLINIDNIKYLHTRLGGKMNIITADGGFNFSINHYIQEYNASQLIFAELVTALGCLSLGGVYIYKIYDMSYKITADILFITQCFFTEIEIFKPLTSRSGNSERYVICKGFKGIFTADINKLIMLLELWINNNKSNDIEIEKFIRNKLFYEKNNYNIEKLSIIDNFNINIPQAFYNLISKINKIFNDKQIENIKDTLNINYCNKWVLKRKEEQRLYAIKWCKDNNMSY